MGVNINIEKEAYKFWYEYGITDEFLIYHLELSKLRNYGLYNIIQPLLHKDKQSMTVLRALLEGYIDYSTARCLSRFKMIYSYREEDWIQITDSYKWWEITKSPQATFNLIKYNIDIMIARDTINVNYIDGTNDYVQYGKLYAYGLIPDDNLLLLNNKTKRYKLKLKHKLIIKI